MEAPPLEELPPIDFDNAAAYPPPSLIAFRTAASRAPANCAPARWFKQMTGSEWDRSSHSYEIQKKRWRRLGDDAYQERETKRLRERVVDGRKDNEYKKTRAEQHARDAEDAENMRADNIFEDLLGRARLLGFYWHDPRYFEQPLVPSLLAAPLNSDQPLGPAARQRYSRYELWEATSRLHNDLVDSADYLELLWLPKDEPTEEFVYRLSSACEDYLDFFDELHKRGAPTFSLPTEEEEPTIAAISRLGRQPHVPPLENPDAPRYWEGDESRLVQTQVCSFFPEAAAERLQRACYGWLYDNAPHVMACLDRHWGDRDEVDELFCTPDGSRASHSVERIWRWRLEPPPSRADVFRAGGLRADQRGICHELKRGFEGLCGGRVAATTVAATTAMDVSNDENAQCGRCNVQVGATCMEGGVLV
jgi:hypothetical protein